MTRTPAEADSTAPRLAGGVPWSPSGWLALTAILVGLGACNAADPAPGGPAAGGPSASVASALKEKEARRRSTAQAAGRDGPHDPSQPPPAALEPGTLPGSLVVSATGTATYAIPLTIIPGVNGLQPQLGLDYSSGTGDGLLGVGWSLGGLSSIARCPSNLRREGHRDPITLSTRDLLCLDGERLVALNPKLYGKNGGEYRTAVNANIRVVEHDPMGQNGSSFTVYYADGRIASYGGTNDATVKVYAAADATGAETATPVEWKVQRVADRYNNEIVYRYSFTKLHDVAGPRSFDTDHHLDVIRYSGDRTIELGYEPRPDVISGYFNGVYNQVTQRLARIVMSGQGDPYRTYGITYASTAPAAFPDADTGRSRIEALRECNGDGSRCKPPTLLTWHTGVTGASALALDGDHIFDDVPFPKGTEPLPSEPKVLKQLIGDFDDNGGSDLLVAQQYAEADGGTWKLWSSLVTGLGFHRAETYVPVRLFPEYETKPGVHSSSYHFDLGAPTAQAIDYDGRDGTDAAVLLPAKRLGNLLADPSEPIFQEGVHPWVGEGFQIIHRKSDGTFAETLVKDTTHHILYAYWMNLDGDQLSDVVFCRGAIDVDAVYAGVVDGHFEPSWDAPTDLWSRGRLAYIVNKPGEGISFANMKLTTRSCAFNDMIQVIDVDGDGDDELLYVGNAKAPHASGGAAPVPPESWDAHYTALTFNTRDNVVSVLPLEHALPVDYLERLRHPWEVPRYGASTDIKGDFNGDGLTDLARFELDDGDGVDQIPQILTVRTFNDAITWPQFPGEQPSDKGEDGHVVIYMNTGRGFVPTDPLIELDTAAAYWRHFSSAFTMDYNGDGITDLMMRDPDKGLWGGYLEDSLIYDYWEEPWGGGAGGLEYDDADWAKLHVFLGDPQFFQHDALVEAETPILHQFDRWKEHWNDCDLQDSYDGTIPGLDEPGGVFDDDGEPVDVEGEIDDEDQQCTEFYDYRYFLPRRHYLPMDANSDGLTDIVTFAPDSWLARLKVWSHAGAHRFDLVTAVQNGLGATDRVEYAPMSNPWGVYSHQELAAPNVPPELPVRTMMSGQPLVRALHRDAGIVAGVERTWEYAYRNARADVIEGTMLGFEFVTARESRANGPDYGQWDSVVKTWYDATTYDPVSKQFTNAGAVRARVEASYAEGYLHEDEPQTVYHVRKVREVHQAGTTDLTDTYRTDLGARYTEDWDGSSFEVDDVRLFCLLILPNPCGNYGSWSGGNALSSWEEHYTSYDGYGHAWRYDATLPDASTVHVDRFYQNDATTWLIGLLTSETVTNATPLGTESRKQVTAYTPEGTVLSVVSEPDDATLKRGVLYARAEGHGNVTRETVVTSSDWGTHFVDTAWSPDGLYPITSTNALNHITAMEWVDELGAIKRTVEPDGNYQEIDHDDFGKVIETRRYGANGALLDTPRHTSYWIEEPAPGMRETVIHSEAAGLGDGQTVVDRLGRTIRTMTTGANGNHIYQDTVYDVLGRVARVSQPTFLLHEVIGDPSQVFTQYESDFLGRPRRVLAADGTAERIVYHDRRVSVIDPEERTSTKWLDKLGRVERWIDGQDDQWSTPTTEMCAAYGPWGTMRTVQPCTPTAARSPVTFTYDRLGRTTHVEDAQTGPSTITFNSFGELFTVTNAEHKTTTFYYDVLGRVVERLDADQGSATWSYDVPVKGAPSGSTSPDGHEIHFEYDDGDTNRLTATETTVDGQVYRFEYQYDPVHDRPAMLTYPTVEGQEPFAIRYGYDQAGVLQSLAEVGGDATPYWSRSSVNVFGQDQLEFYGNGVATSYTYHPQNARLETIHSFRDGQPFRDLEYHWKEGGSLQWRRDSSANLLLPQLETFGYDALDRVTSVEMTDDVHVRNTAFQYDGVGNITSRDLETYSYGGDRLTGVAGGDHDVTYVYDGMGNRKTQNEVGLSPMTFTYNLGNKVVDVRRQDESVHLAFEYDADGDLVYRKDFAANSWSTYVAGGLFERRIDPALGPESIKDVYSVMGPGGAVAQVTRTYEEPGPDYGVTTRYLHRDHQGSVNVVTDEQGAAVQWMSFDVFGKRRAADWFGNQSWLEPEVTAGYTGHENTLEALGLINMRGRVYDATQGRFMQPDPMVQAPYFSQSVNRYAYVFNNPLAFVDPTGYEGTEEGVRVEREAERQSDGSYNIIGAPMFSSDICVCRDDDRVKIQDLSRAFEPEVMLDQWRKMNARFSNMREAGEYLNNHYGTSAEDLPSVIRMNQGLLGMAAHPDAFGAVFVAGMLAAPAILLGSAVAVAGWGTVTTSAAATTAAVGNATNAVNTAIMTNRAAWNVYAVGTFLLGGATAGGYRAATTGGGSGAPPGVLSRALSGLRGAFMPRAPAAAQPVAPRTGLTTNTIPTATGPIASTPPATVGAPPPPNRALADGYRGIPVRGGRVTAPGAGFQSQTDWAPSKSDESLMGFMAWLMGPPR